MKKLITLVIVAVLNISVFTSVGMAQNKNDKKPTISYKVTDWDFLKRVTVAEVENKDGKCTLRIDYNFDGSIFVRVFVSTAKTPEDHYYGKVFIKSFDGKPIAQNQIPIINKRIEENACIPGLVEMSM